MKNFLATFVFVLGLIWSATVRADSNCSATNTNGDQTCSISCPAGQSAQCTQGIGSNSPTCECLGTPDPPAHLKNGGWKLAEKKRFVPLENKDAPPQILTNVPAVLNAKLATMRDYHLS